MTIIHVPSLVSLTTGVDEAAADPNLLGVAVITVVQPLGQHLVPGLPAKDVDVAAVGAVGGRNGASGGDDGARAAAVGSVLLVQAQARVGDVAEANELGVPVLANLEAASLVLEAEALGAAAGGEVKDLLGGELALLLLLAVEAHGDVARDEGSLAGVFENRGRVAAADVGAQADVDALLPQPADAGGAAGDGGVAAGAVGDLALAEGDEAGLLLGQVDGVGEDHLGVEQAVVVVDLGVGAGLGEQLADELDLAGVFGNVRLGEVVIVLLQLGEGRHGLAGARGGEARGDDGGDAVVGRVNLLHVVNGLLGGLDGGLGGLVAVVVRVEARHVHADAADKGALADGEAQVRQQVGGGDVDGGVVGGGGGAVGQGAADDGRVDAAGPVEVLEAGLDGEGVLLEPVEEGSLAKDACVGVLRGVNVGVWKGVCWLVIWFWCLLPTL